MTAPDVSPGRIGAIILAGGRSARFGRDKLAEPMEGRPLLEWAIDAVRSIDPKIDVVVVAAPGATKVVPAGIRLAHDAMAYEGPLAGMAEGLRSFADDIDHVVVVGGDMPDLVPAVLRRLVEALRDDPALDLAILQEGDAARPLPAAVRRVRGLSTAESLLGDGERRMRALAEVLRTTVIPESAWRTLDPSGATLHDIDTPDDLPTVAADVSSGTGDP
jgi:molybdopterin-guanine dinucleotide biosynthesis protein A